jgi:hypothetical protein
MTATSAKRAVERLDDTRLSPARSRRPPLNLRDAVDTLAVAGSDERGR